MQEEITNRTIALGEKGTKFTAQMLLKMMREYVNLVKQGVNKAIQSGKAKDIPHGKMTVEELVKQNKGANAMVVADLNDWDKVAKKYGVDYAVTEAPVLGTDGKQLMKDDKPLFQYNVYFKAQDTDIITEAFKAYMKEHDKTVEKEAKKEQNREHKKEVKAEKQKKKIEKKNIKAEIKKNKERADKLNKKNPEKHHNRGDRSL